MDNIFQFFNQGWVGSLIGIIGILVAIITFKASKTAKRLVYQSETLKIIGKDSITLDEIEITYKKKQVPRVIKTTITIWNSGKETINGSDIVEDDKLRIELNEDKEIISLNLIQKTRTVNKFNAILDKNNNNKAILTFDYLDPNDGIILEILHTDSKWQPKLKGSIKGLPKGCIDWSNNSAKIPYKNEKNPYILAMLETSYKDDKIFTIASFFLGSMLISFGLFYKEIESFTKEFPIIDNAGRICIIIIGIIQVIYSIINLKLMKKPPKKLNLNTIYKDKNDKEKNMKIS